jgi:DNA-binding response OmpR family regulator
MTTPSQELTMPLPAVDLTGARILAVDDVPENLDILLHTLEETGYEVLVAADGAQALKVAASARPDAILLDVMMPGIDGYETCRRLKAQSEFRDVPVLFLTARDDIEGVIEGFTAGGVDYIVKPFRKEEVLVRIRTHLERDRYARDLADLNAHLEEKVLERTAQLRLSLRELQGRDRIARHMLTLHPLQETLDLVLDVISGLVEVDRAVLWTLVDDKLQPVSTSGNTPSGPSPTVATVRQSGTALRDTTAEEAFAVVPIEREGQLLGLIEVGRARDQPLLDQDVRVLESFALEAAVAINDSQIRRDPRDWEDHLDEILEIDDEISQEEYFRRLEDGGSSA